MPIQNPFTSSSVEKQSTHSGSGLFQVTTDDAEHARSKLDQVALAYLQSTRSAVPVETVPGETAGRPQPRHQRGIDKLPIAWAVDMLAVTGFAQESVLAQRVASLPKKVGRMTA
jgi:hypothetical protein